MHRRNWLQQSSLAALALAAGLPALGSSAQAAAVQNQSWQGYRILEFLKLPVVVKEIRLVPLGKQKLVWVRDADGVVGHTICNQRMDYLQGIFDGLVAPFFLNKDARLLPQLVEDVYKEERNYKFGGMPFWNCVGHLEIALWDLLGKKANQPVHALLGQALRSSLPIYLSSLTRNNPAEEEADKLMAGLEKTGCRAVKMKVGGRMKNSGNADERSTQLLALLRKKGGESLTIYADANGSYNFDEAVQMGRHLRDNQVDIFEEPCPWEDFETTKKVADALPGLKLAGGEQDTSFYRFAWYAQHKALSVLQPDVFYNGGLCRALAVAQLARQRGLHFAPHSPKADALEYPFLHLMAVAPAVYGFQEFPLSGVGKKQDDWWGPHFQLNNGQLSIPNQPGLGFHLSPELLKQAGIA